MLLPRNRICLASDNSTRWSFGCAVTEAAVSSRHAMAVAVTRPMLLTAGFGDFYRQVRFEDRGPIGKYRPVRFGAFRFGLQFIVRRCRRDHAHDTFGM